MQKIENPEMSRLILNHLSDLYKIKEKREGIHLSTLVYCLTRSFFDQLAPVEPTDEEVMLFSLGFALQDVLTPSKAVTPVYEKDGITFSPDFVLELEAGKPQPFLAKGGTLTPLKYVELKTTRMSSSKEDLPETWIEYIQGGCYMRGVNEYELAVLYMMGNWHPPFPEIKSYKLIFDDEELQSNWKRLLDRKDVYEEAIRTTQPPHPFCHNKEWECKNCRYILQCQAIQMVNIKKSDEEKDLWD